MLPGFAAWGGQAPANPFLDEVAEPAWSVRLDYVDRAKVEGPDVERYSLATVEGGGGLFFSEAPGGEVECSGSYAVTTLSGGDRLDLPDAVADLHLTAGYLWRSWDGRALRLRVQPGYYGEWGAGVGDAFRLPFEVVGLQALHPKLAGMMGVAVYPGFTRNFDPRFGVRYLFSETWSADLMYPESRLRGRWPGGGELYVLYRNDPINEFWLDGDDPRESFRWEESRLAVGGGLPLGRWLRLLLEAGYVFNRSVDFGDGASARGVDESLFVSAGCGGAW